MLPVQVAAWNHHPGIQHEPFLIALVALLPSFALAFPADFDGDGKNDLVVWRPSDGTWYVVTSSGSTPACFSTFLSGNKLQFGLPGDKPFSADFDGDGRADASVYRPSNQTIYIKPSSWCPTGSLLSVSMAPYGITSTDMPDEGNAEGGGVSDILFYRPPSGGTTGIMYTRTAAGYVTSWGLPTLLNSTTDVPTVLTGNYQANSPANFLGAEPAAYNKGSTTYLGGNTSAVAWSWLSLEGGQFSVGYTTGHKEIFNTSDISFTDIPVPGNIGGSTALLWDFNWWRPSTGAWRTTYNGVSGVGPILWGVAGDIPVGADFNGDGLIDRAVFRPSEGRWYVNMAGTPNCPAPFSDAGSANGLRICFRDWGLSGDIPLG